MFVKLEYELSRIEYAAGVAVLTEQLARHDRSSERRIWEQLALSVIVILVAGAFFPDLLWGLLVAVVLFGLAEWLLRGRVTRQVSGISYDPAVATMVLEFTDAGISEEAGARSRRWTWDAVRTLHDRGSLLVLELAGWDMIAVPDRVWQSPEEKAAFEEQLRSRGVKGPELAQTSTAPLPPMLVVGAIAAAVDVMFLATYLFPTSFLSAGAGNHALRIAAAVVFVLVILGAGYVAYRAAKHLFGRLQQRSAGAAATLAQLLVWPIPIYILVSATLYRIG